MTASLRRPAVRVLAYQGEPLGRLRSDSLRSRDRHRRALSHRLARRFRAPGPPPHAGCLGHSIALICPHVSAVLEDNRPSAAVKAEVYREYGITHHTYGQYEVDHLVPLELDGSNSIRNLWPEPVLHNKKDVLENRLHHLVCYGQLSLAAAQHAIVTDWRKAYTRYVGKP